MCCLASVGQQLGNRRRRANSSLITAHRPAENQMRYLNSIIDAIGNTPLIRLNHLGSDLKPTILLKAEFLNPGGSIKDRLGAELVIEAARKGLLKPGGTVVEPTSGNTGIGIAMIAAQMGFKMIFTMPDKVSKEKEALLRAYGAEVIRCPTDAEPDDPRSYYEVAKKIVRENPDAYSPNQYENMGNPQAHYETTGPEIWRDTDGRITHFVAGMGTGGTITGVARYLKEQNPAIRIIGGDPAGSIYHRLFYNTNEEVHTYLIEGVGEDFMPKTMDLTLVDELIQVSDKDAYDMARLIASEESILVGSSAGVAMFAALKVAEKLDADDVMVVLLPDTGRNYISTVFNAEWLEKKGLL